MFYQKKTRYRRAGLPTRYALVVFLLIMLAAFPTYVHGRDIQLAWNANTEPDIAGYKIYYGFSSRQYSTVINVGNQTTYTLTGLDDIKTYYIAATAYNLDNLESDYSTEIVATASSSGGGGGGGCFLATAAYGSYHAPEVLVLRNFRDHSLLTNEAGRYFVMLYYRLSPPAADFISRHDWMRTLTRWALSPIVYALQYSHAVMALLFLAGLANTAYRGIKSRRLRRIDVLPEDDSGGDTITADNSLG